MSSGKIELYIKLYLPVSYKTYINKKIPLRLRGIFVIFYLFSGIMRVGSIIISVVAIGLR